MDRIFFCTYRMRCMVGGAIMFAISGCATHRSTGGMSIVKNTDSDIRVDYRVIYQTDTVYADIPKQTAERTTKDNLSRLENDYAISEAHINPDGSLFHNLSTKPQKMPVEYQKPIEQKDSTSTLYIYKEVDKEVPVEVERKLSFMETASIRLFPWSIVFLTISIGVCFRKRIFSIIRKCLSP